ncbi:rho GTPase-activating protein 45-like isoform X5 [Varroa destructor]|uniref:Minor histocompatibility protein HA-1 n=1 Tax=Varroa destructor TaxID=109461 RepID=A0A7M7M3Z2_VARDE|nr:rho GTPase-activating protein 45-like isoform X5 [Varroa destructor]
MSRKKDDKYKPHDKRERHDRQGHSEKPGYAGYSGFRAFMESSIVPHKASRRASLPYRNVMDLAKALCKTCRQRRASYAAGVIMALPGIIQTFQPDESGRNSPASCKLREQDQQSSSSTLSIYASSQAAPGSAGSASSPHQSHESHCPHRAGHQQPAGKYRKHSKRRRVSTRSASVSAVSIGDSSASTNACISANTTVMKSAATPPTIPPPTTTSASPRPLSESRRPSYHSRNPSSSSLMGGGGAGSGGSGASASALPLADPISRSVSMTSVNSCDFPEHRHLHHHHQCLTGGPGIAVSNRGLQQQITQQSAAQLSFIVTGPASGAIVVEREDLLALTHDVRNFKEALGKLKHVFVTERERLNNTELLVSAHERLGEVLRILREILQKYSPIQSSVLLLSASNLIQNVKNYNYEESDSAIENNSQMIYDAIDQLALAFSSRVSEYLMGDLDTNAGKARSCENIASPDSDHPRGYESVSLTAQDVDARLMRLNEGVECALRRAKVWSKYAKDVMTYVEKRAQLEAEHARNLLKLAQTMRPLLKEESFLPFQSIYCTAIDQDLDNANNCLSNCTLLHDHKFVEPLAAGRNEHDKMRKQIKEAWQRELKKMQDADSNVRKCRLLYIQRQHEYEKARERGTDETIDPQKAEQKAEKRRKAEEEILVKVREAEAAYKATIVEANDAAASIEKTKADVLKQVRELIVQCDNTMKAVTVAYFQLQHSVTAPAPVQFQTLCESSRLYEPGSQYTEFVKRIPMPMAGSKPERPQYTFEPYRSEAEMGSDENLARAGLQERRLSTDEKIKRALWPSSHSDSRPSQATVQTRPSNACQSITSDSDSVSSNRSRDTSPTASPHLAGHTSHTGHGMVHASSGDELEADTVEAGAGVNRKMCLSRAAETHNFRKLKTPSRCRECDSYVYFQGVECSECGLSSHKKCLETLAIQCGHKRLPRRMTTFGVDLVDHAQFSFNASENNVEDVPFIVKKCVKENDKRGCSVQGIYRVSAAKSKVEKLCQCFENGAELVDLSDYHPNVIANVLKLYLRQLPEPLLTYNLYPEFIAIAKEFPSNREDSTAAVGILRKTAKNLPRVHYSTLDNLLKHLRRIASNSESNHMPASNLGIVFGPTLLRTREGSASLSNLVDTVHQSRVIELLITYVDEIFDTDMRDKSVSDLLNFHKLSVDSASVPRSKSGSFRRRSDRSGSRRGNKPSSKDDFKLDSARRESAKEGVGLLSATSATNITSALQGISSSSHDLNTSLQSAIINGTPNTSLAPSAINVNTHRTINTSDKNTSSLRSNVAVTSPKLAEKKIAPSVAGKYRQSVCCQHLHICLPIYKNRFQ